MDVKCDEEEISITRISFGGDELLAFSARVDC